MKIVEFINRLITHNRDDEGDFGIRVILHIPAGILMGLFLLDKKLFLEYEKDECAHTKDEAWKDIAGAMIGYVIGRTIWLIIIALIIYLLSVFLISVGQP